MQKIRVIELATKHEGKLIPQCARPAPAPSFAPVNDFALSGVVAPVPRARVATLTWLRTGAELLWALRPHFFVLPALAALAGAASAAPPALSWRSALAAVIAAAGWGAGQLLNDFLDRASDAINAPDRAIVAGRLPARWPSWVRCSSRRSLWEVPFGFTRARGR